MTDDPVHDWATVYPHLRYREPAAAIDWLTRVFGFRERVRMARPDGSIITSKLEGPAGGLIMVAGDSAEFHAWLAARLPGATEPRERSWPNPSHTMTVLVPDVDAHHERAKGAGATIVMPPADQPWGLRCYVAVDPEGHLWEFSQVVRIVEPEAWGATRIDDVHRGGTSPHWLDRPLSPARPTAPEARAHRIPIEGDTPMGSILAEMFKHNAWANRQLLDACAALGDDQLAAGAPGTYGTIRDTLLHLAGAQDRYLAALRGEQPANTIHERIEFPGIAALQEHLGRSSDALVAVAEQGDEDRVLRGVRNGEPYALPASVFLIQAINHATDHRSQIASIMGGMGIEPPDIDGWAYAVSTAAVS